MLTGRLSALLQSRTGCLIEKKLVFLSMVLSKERLTEFQKCRKCTRSSDVGLTSSYHEVVGDTSGCLLIAELTSFADLLVGAFDAGLLVIRGALQDDLSGDLSGLVLFETVGLGTFICVGVFVSCPEAFEATGQLFESGIESVVHSALVLHVVANT